MSYENTMQIREMKICHKLPQKPPVSTCEPQINAL